MEIKIMNNNFNKTHIDDLQMQVGETLKILIKNHLDMVHKVEVNYIGLDSQEERFISFKVYINERSYRVFDIPFDTNINIVDAKIIEKYFNTVYNLLISDKCEIYVMNDPIKAINQYMN